MNAIVVDLEPVEPASCSNDSFYLVAVHDAESGRVIPGILHAARPLNEAFAYFDGASLAHLPYGSAAEIGAALTRRGVAARAVHLTALPIC